MSVYDQLLVPEPTFQSGYSFFIIDCRQGETRYGIGSLGLQIGLNLSILERVRFSCMEELNESQKVTHLVRSPLNFLIEFWEVSHEYESVKGLRGAQ